MEEDDSTSLFKLWQIFVFPVEVHGFQMSVIGLFDYLYSSRPLLVVLELIREHVGQFPH